MSVFYIDYKWSDKILEDLHCGLLDLAIYNTERAIRYISSRNRSPLVILENYGYSMGGNNFFVLSKDVSRKDIDLTSKQNFLCSIEGTTIGVPFNSDIHTNFHHAFCVTDDEIEHHANLIDIPTSYGPEIFDIRSDLLLLTGQNTRFQAKYTDGIEEIIGVEDISVHEKQYLHKKSSNSLILNKDSIGLMKQEDMKFLGCLLKYEFLNSWGRTEGFEYNLTKMIDLFAPKMNSRSEAEYIIRKILFETYRFGNPIV